MACVCVCACVCAPVSVSVCRWTWSRPIYAHGAQESLGLVGQALCEAVRDEMADYDRLLAVLDAQVKATMDAEADGAEEPDPTSLTLRRLFVWTQDPQYRLLTLARVVEAVEGLRGGALASGALPSVVAARTWSGRRGCVHARARARSVAHARVERRPVRARICGAVAPLLPSTVDKNDQVRRR